MSALRKALQEYLALRRGLGFKMRDAGLVLPRFVAFMEERQALHITTRLALEWVQQAKTVQPAERARRLCFVRAFARYRSATDPLTEVPSPELLPYSSTRARPYLYTEQEVQALLEAALQLPTAWPSTPLRPWVFHCLLGLLSVTGLRISEALDLKLDDVDLEQGVLTIRAAKFGRFRLVPSIHPHAPCSSTTFSAANSSSARAARTTCSFLIVARGSTSVAFIEPSTRYRGKQACGRLARAMVPGCTTSGTALRFKCSSAGTSPARTRRDDCRCCRPISGTCTWLAPTGISATGLN
jgi:site-specific recombinase XerD